MPILQLVDINKSFANKVHVLKNINLNIQNGEVVALIGASGSGKSTLLHIMGLLDKPSSGKVLINNTDYSNASDKQRTLLRRNFLGFVYQFHYLLQEFSTIENVMISQIIFGKGKKEARINSEKILEKVGLKDKMSSKIHQLSGGEKQRVAIARALVNTPPLFLADEPTGNLDPETSQSIFSLLVTHAKEKNISIFFVTHNHELAKAADTIVRLQNGVII